MIRIRKPVLTDVYWNSFIIVYFIIFFQRSISYFAHFVIFTHFISFFQFCDFFGEILQFFKKTLAVSKDNTGKRRWNHDDSKWTCIIRTEIKMEIKNDETFFFKKKSNNLHKNPRGFIFFRSAPIINFWTDFSKNVIISLS